MTFKEYLEDCIKKYYKHILIKYTHTNTHTFEVIFFTGETMMSSTLNKSYLNRESKYNKKKDNK